MSCRVIIAWLLTKVHMVGGHEVKCKILLARFILCYVLHFRLRYAVPLALLFCTEPIAIATASLVAQRFTFFRFYIVIPHVPISTIIAWIRGAKIPSYIHFAHTFAWLCTCWKVIDKYLYHPVTGTYKSFPGNDRRGQSYKKLSCCEPLTAASEKLQIKLVSFSAPDWKQFRKAAVLYRTSLSLNFWRNQTTSVTN